MTSTWSAVPRLCAVASREAATLVRPSQDLEAICGLGFNALLLPGEVFRGCSDTATGEGANGLDWAALATLVTAAGASGLAIVLDVDLSVFPVDHPLVRAHPNAFSVRPGRGEDAPLDPRKSAPDDGLARIRGGATAGVAALAAWAGAGLDRARAAGVQGVRLSRPSALSTQTWGDILAQAPDLTVIAASLDDRGSAAAFARCGVDYLTTSLAWWDGRAAWLVEEYGALCAAAPLVGDISAVESAGAVRAVGLAPMVTRGLIASLGQIGGTGVPVEALRTVNRQLEALAAYDGELRSLTGPGARVAALIRAAGPDLRSASAALVALVNPDEASQASVDADEVLGASPLPLANLERLQGSGDPLAPLAPGEVRLLTATRAKPIIIPTRPVQPGADAAAEAARIAIEAVSPSVDGGRFPVKRTVGDRVVVEADVFADGHEQLAAALLWRAADGEDWRATPMTALGNDRWRAEFAPDRMGRHLFAVEAWLDVFGGFRRDLTKKRHAGVATPLDVAEGVRLVEQARDRSEGALRSALADMLAQVEAAAPDARVAHMLSPDLAALMQQADPRPYRVRSEAQPLDAERLGARFSSWYELFPRSQGPVPQAGEPPRHGTFDDVIARLPAVRAMGFDVLYMPPIHPIGHQNRKGRNNSLTAGPDDPGSPYAIGADAGGHDAVHPELGGIEGFDRLVAAARAQGLEIALDFAVQCAPDHPWLKAHPGWFDYRPDGSIKYAENPPKTYEDIVNVDFYQPDAVPDLWLALRDAVLFWVEHGVRLFRVDNPHTKPLPFWEWMIADVRGRYPDTVFLAEAFTRPKLMYRLAKIGFSQSYTYFTWRHTKAELTEYLTELTTTAPKDFFRPHFFVNTPDINPYFLQTSGRAGFLIRAALAATLSGLFGVYSGFELLEAEPVLGKEDYKDSEKYEIKPRDWTRPGDIIAEITRLNAIRKANPALQTHLGVRFYTAFNDQVLYFGKAASDADGGVRSEMVLVAVSLDPHASQGFDFEIPLWEWGLPDDGELAVEDLLSQTRFAWRGKRQNWVLTPDRPYAIWCVQPVTGS